MFLGVIGYRAGHGQHHAQESPACYLWFPLCRQAAQNLCQVCPQVTFAIFIISYYLLNTYHLPDIVQST